MIYRGHRRYGVFLVMALAVYMAGDMRASQDALPLRGVRIPIECYATGRVKVELKAERADVHESGDMNAYGVRVTFFDPTGRVETVVIADDCLFNKKSNTITSDRPVRMERQGVVITGRGFLWETAVATVRILNDVRVVLDGRLNAMQKGVFSKMGLP